MKHEESFFGNCQELRDKVNILLPGSKVIGSLFVFPTVIFLVDETSPNFIDIFAFFKFDCEHLLIISEILISRVATFALGEAI